MVSPSTRGAWITARALLLRYFVADIQGETVLEARAGIEPAYTDLQSAASPLRHRAPRKRLEGAQMGKQQQSVKRNRAFVERGGEYAWPKRTIPIEGSVDAAVLHI